MTAGVTITISWHIQIDIAEYKQKITMKKKEKISINQQAKTNNLPNHRIQ